MNEEDQKTHRKWKSSLLLIPSSLLYIIGNCVEEGKGGLSDGGVQGSLRGTLHLGNISLQDTLMDSMDQCNIMIHRSIIYSND